MGTTEGFRTPMMMLQDPELTKVILVTLPEPTPVTEARVLQDDLRRAGIHPWAWVVNTSLAAAIPQSAFLRRRAAAEAEQVAVVESLTERVAIVPLLNHEPVGETHLASLTAHERESV
jgi:arsenite-transporting ATPase